MSEIYNRLMQGIQMGEAGRQQKQQRQFGSALGDLLSGGDRNAAMGVMAQANPSGAMQAQGLMGKMDEQKLARLGQRAAMFMAAPPEIRAQMYPQMAQEANAMGFPVPMEYRPEMDAMLAQLAQKAGSAGGVQSTQIGDDGFFYTVDRATGRFVNSGVKASPSLRVLEQEGQLPYGVVTGRGVPGQVVGLGAQQSAPQQQALPTQFIAPDGVPTQIDPSLPPEVQAAIRSDPQAWAQAPDQSQANIGPQPAAQPQQLPPALDFQRGGQVGPVRIPTAAEKAAAVEAAERAVGLQFAPAEADAAANEARLRREAERGVDLAFDKEAARPKARLAMQQARSRFERVDELIRDIEPNIGLWTAGFLGSRAVGIEGTPAHDLARNLDTLKAIAGFDELNAMRASSPTGGALGNVTERELAFLQSVVASIESSQSPDQLRRNIARFRREVKSSWERVNEAYEEDFGGGQASGKRLRFNPATGRIE